MARKQRAIKQPVSVSTEEVNTTTNNRGVDDFVTITSIYKRNIFK